MYRFLALRLVVVGSIPSVAVGGASARSVETPGSPGGGAPVSADALAELAELDDLLNTTIAGGEVGSFGARLSRSSTAAYIHGYAVVDFFRQGEGPNTFDLHYFNVLVGANIYDRLVPEMQIEIEHGGEEIQLRYGQIDIVLIGEHVVVRAGKFLVPFGVYNEFLYPEFISKTPDRPFALREIVPVSWAESGVQLRGTVGTGAEKLLSYAVYVINGLEQRASADDAVAPDGGGIRSMRGNERDKNHGNKAIGARLEVRPLPGLSLGASWYTGKYTVDGASSLSLFGGDLYYDSPWVTVHSEFTYAAQQTRAGTLHKRGGYALLGVPVHDTLEPLVMVDWIMGLGAKESNKTRYTAGVVVTPLPAVTRNFVVKITYAWTRNKGTDIDEDKFFVQSALGF